MDERMDGRTEIWTPISHPACLKGMSRTITMQGFRLAAISDVEKTKLRRKNFQSQWTVKYRSRAPG